MDEVTIDQLLAKIGAHLKLSKETEHELLAEMRTHLEDAVAEARAKGEDEEQALLEAAERFGLDEVGEELQEVHADWESIDAILASAAPVLFALVMRWLVFAPDGTAIGWAQLLTRPGFWIIAVAALVIPAYRLKRWRFALVGWGVFWLLTVIFVLFPNVNQW